MRGNLIAFPALCSLVAASAAHLPHPGWLFRPQTGGVLSAGASQFPSPYNLSTSQTNLDAASSNGSYWLSSLIHGSNGHDYLVVSHTIFGPPAPEGTGIYRASILDITNTSEYSQYAKASPLDTAFTSSGALNATYADFGFSSSSSADPLAGIRTYNNVCGTKFDLTFKLSAPALLNAGSGTFWVGGGLGYQWSMPAGETTGWIEVQGKRVDVVPSRSQTWFDRQWGVTPPKFTWFQVHLPGQSVDASHDEVFSVWAWTDPVNGDKAFTTSRTGNSHAQPVYPFTWQTVGNETYNSPITGQSWPLAWKVNIEGGPELELRSIKTDQEIASKGNPIFSYTGFLDVVARYPGGRIVPGFAVIESV